MRDYEEKSFYEIQLDNKQLILVFLAGVTVCVLVFILGVMVGKGRKEAEYAAATRNEKEATVRPEPDLSPPQEIQEVNSTDVKQKKEKKATEAAQKPAQDAYEYYNLDETNTEKPMVKEPGKKKEEAKAEKKEPEKKEPDKKEPEKKEPEKKAEPEPAKVAVLVPEQPSQSVQPEPEPVLKDGGRYTVQVMATGSKAKAEQQLADLVSKGYTAFMNEEKAGDAPVFKVRVGKFTDQDSARKTASRLKQELQLETWVAVLE